MEEVELFAPNRSKIIGVLTADGASRSFKYSYDRSSKVRLYVLEDGTSISEDAIQLIAADGTRWKSEDAEWYTLFERKL
jgi:hypothetical protein